MRVVSFVMAAVAAVAVSAGGARAALQPDPGETAGVPVGTCWITSAYFDNSTVTRICFVSEGTATYEGRVADVPDLRCQGKATVAIEGNKLTIVERDGICDVEGHTWTAEAIACTWDASWVESGGPVGCTVDEPNYGRAKFTLSRD